jgi:hypothetical protein
MANVYQIGIQIALAGSYAHQLQLLAQQFGLLHTQVGQIQQGIGRWGAAIIGVGGVLAGSELLKGVTHLMKAGEEILNQQAKAKIIGLSQIQIQEEYAKSVEIGERVRGSLIHENIALINEMYSIAGFEEAMALAPQMAQISQILQRFGAPAGGAYELIKALDLMGRISDPETKKFDSKRASEAMDLFAQMTEATSGKVTVAQFLAFAKQGGPLMGSMSDEGVRAMGSFIQDVGGYRAGTALQALGRQFVGGIMTQSKAMELHKLGLLGDYEVGKGGHIIIGPGQMPIGDEILKDPLKMAHMFSEAFKKSGITTPEDVQKETYKIFSTGPAQRIMYEMIRNEMQKRGEIERMGGAATTEAATRILGEESPAQVMANYANAWKNLTEVVGMPLMKAAIPIINEVAAALERMATVAAGHPEAMKLALEIVGGLAIGSLVLGLGAIATAIAPLIGAAGLLTALAAALAALAAFNWDWLKGLFSHAPATGSSPGGGPGIIDTPGGAGMVGPHTGKHSYNAVPPPAGGGSGTGGGDVYLDSRKVGEILTGTMARMAGGPLEGSSYFDGTWSSPASDLSLSYG